MKNNQITKNTFLINNITILYLYIIQANIDNFRIYL